MQRIPIEQLSEMPNRAEPPRSPRRIRRIAATTEMRGQARHPRLPQTPINDLEQSPNRPLGQPRIRISLDPRSRRNRIPNQPPRRRELDVRAHPIAPPNPRPEPIRHPLCQPPLHPARWHRDDLRRKRVGHGIGQKRAKRLDQAVGALSSMYVKHVVWSLGPASSARSRISTR
jgi:hypothetical protein